jgi:hypothetical protein
MKKSSADLNYRLSTSLEEIVNDIIQEAAAQ